jgi:hypothetical protein
MLVKFAEADGGSNGELMLKNSKINEWEELTLILLQELVLLNQVIDQLIPFYGPNR